MRHLRLLPILLVLAACGEKQAAPRTEQAPTVEQTMAHTAGVAVQAGRDAKVTVNNYQKSQDYQDLLAKRDDAQENVQKYPDDAKFRQVLTTTEQNLENFKRNVLKLAEEINKFPVNTERLKQAVALFNAQQYAEARKVLDAGEITQEQDALLAKQRRLQEEQETITAQLDDKANEWLLKAQLTAIDYSLGDQRIAQTSGYFEKALKSGRTPERLFDYAKFLQDNNQYHEAEKLYTEALTLSRQLAKDNPAVYLLYVSTALNNLGLLATANGQRLKEAETLFTEALTLYRQLAKDNPAVYLRYVAVTLNNLAVSVKADSQRRKEVETLYTESLTLSRHLAKDNPDANLPDVAMTLNNLAGLVKADKQRQEEAEKLYTEALTLSRQLSKSNLAAYSHHNMISILNNFGTLVSNDSYRSKEAEKLYTEALTLSRQLAKDNPAVYLPDVAMTLNNLGVLIAADSQRHKEAETFYIEALTLRRQLAKDNPEAHVLDVVTTLKNFGDFVAVSSQRRSEAEKLYTEALTLSRQLAKNNPDIYLPGVATTLAAFGMTYLGWGELDQAMPMLQESAQLLAPLAEKDPSVFGEKHYIIQQLIEIFKAVKR